MFPSRIFADRIGEIFKINVQTKVPILATHVDMKSNTTKMSSIPGQRVTKYLTYNRENVQSVVIN